MKAKKAEIYQQLGAEIEFKSKLNGEWRVDINNPMSSPTHRYRIAKKDRAIFKKAYKDIIPMVGDPAVIERYKAIDDLSTLKNGNWYYILTPSGCDNEYFDWLVNGNFFESSDSEYYCIDVVNCIFESLKGQKCFSKEEILLCREATPAEVVKANNIVDVYKDEQGTSEANPSPNTTKDRKSSDAPSDEASEPINVDPEDLKDDTWYVITDTDDVRWLCNGSFTKDTGNHYHIVLGSFDIFPSFSKYMPKKQFKSAILADDYHQYIGSEVIKTVELPRIAMGLAYRAVNIDPEGKEGSTTSKPPISLGSVITSSKMSPEAKAAIDSLMAALGLKEVKE